MIKYSIIIPCYNVTRYIHSAIESLPMRKDLEIIIVDDGSSDNLKSNLALSDVRVRYYYKENGGVSSARNFGIDQAKGEYVCFLDADDSYSEGFFEKFDSIIDNSEQDIYCFNYLAISSRGCIIEHGLFGLSEGSLDYTSVVKSLFLRTGFQHICSMVFKRELLCEVSAKFNELVHYYEDIQFQIELVFSAKNIFYSKEIMLNYVEREGSAVNSAVCERTLTIFSTLNEIKSFIIKNDIPLIKEYEYFFNHTVVWLYKCAFKYGVSNTGWGILDIDLYRTYVFPANKKQAFVSLLSIFPRGLVSFIIKFFLKVRNV